MSVGQWRSISVGYLVLVTNQHLVRVGMSVLITDRHRCGVGRSVLVIQCWLRSNPVLV